jgi:hypothetical protein
MKKTWLKTTAFIIAAATGLFLFIYLFDESFPTASLDLRLDRHQAQEKAREYLTSLGCDLKGYTSSVDFDGDYQSFVFLEKCLGLRMANETAKEKFPIWYWQVRFFKELQKEGYEVHVNPIGRIDGFTHSLEDQAPGDMLEQERAKTIALNFLAQKKIDSNEYELIEASSSKQEKRTDHHFVWKKKASEISWKEGAKEGTGMVRLSVTVLGSHVGEFATYLWVPETFGRYINKLSSEGNFLALIASFFSLLLYIAAIIMFIASFRNKGIPFRYMITIALIMGIPYLFMAFNELPLLKAAYDTKINFLVFYGSELIDTMKGLLNRIVVVIIVFCAGMYLGKKLYPDRVSALESVVGAQKTTNRFTQEVLGGYLFAFMILGFVTLFYFYGMKFLGVWSFPAPSYSNLLGTFFPFFEPLALSLLAALSEEFMFRLFGISFLKRFIRITFFAVLIPSLIWAFAHSSYAVYPIYTRGVELTIVAFAFSYVFLRYGILCCIVAHYVIDAVLFSIPLLRSKNPYFFWSGIVVIVLVALPAVLGILCRSARGLQKHTQVV